MKKIIIFLYLFINILFIVKYIHRLDFINSYVVVLGYLLIFFSIIYFFNKINFKSEFYKILFYLFSIIFFGLTIYINKKVNPETLNVDRWSALEVGIKALLSGNYPYSALDHLGGRTSNLPTLFIIGLPFYLLNDVGLLQSFTFLIFVITVFMLFRSYKIRLFVLILLIISPSYLWEIYVKSDLISNFIIVLFFIVFVFKKYWNKIEKNIIGISFASTALLLTRLTVIIPLSLLLFKKFYTFSIKNKLKFVFIALLTLIISFYVVFHKVDSFSTFQNYNPFELQNRQLPIFLSFIIISLSFILSFYVKNLKSLIDFSILVLSISVFSAFLFKIYLFGLLDSIYESKFDISYFNMIMPFVIVALGINYFEEKIEYG